MLLLLHSAPTNTTLPLLLVLTDGGKGSPSPWLFSDTTPVRSRRDALLTLVGAEVQASPLDFTDKQQRESGEPHCNLVGIKVAVPYLAFSDTKPL